MIEVKEIKKANNKLAYLIRVTEEGKPITETECYIHTACIEKGGNSYLIMYDNQMRSIASAFEFLNYAIGDQSINSRIRSMEALKLLFSFECISSKTVSDFSVADVSMLINFLRGIPFTGQTIRFELERDRIDKTVNEFLSTYRDYLRSMGIEEHPLLTRKLTKSMFSYDGGAIPSRTMRYRSSVREPKAIEDVPQYISLWEFKMIIDYVRSQDDLLAEVIVRLMYENGMRIGEVLGLTADDIVEEEYTDPETGNRPAGRRSDARRASDRKPSPAQG